MSDAGKRLIESAQQALDFIEGKANENEYRVHIPQEQAMSDDELKSLNLIQLSASIRKVLVSNGIGLVDASEIASDIVDRVMVSPISRNTYALFYNDLARARAESEDSEE